VARNRVRRSREFWTRTVKEWKESGESQRRFAKSRSIPPSSLCKWAGLLAAEDGSPGVPTVVSPAFVEVRPATTEPDVVAEATPRLRLRFGGVVAEFPRLPPPAYLAAVAQYTADGRC